MFQEVKSITCAANLFIACKVSFTEWRNKIYEFPIHGLADFVTNSSLTVLVCWTRWNLLPCYLLKQLKTVC